VRLPSGDDEKQAKLSLRSVVKTPERKVKLKYYVSKGASIRVGDCLSQVAKLRSALPFSAKLLIRQRLRCN
jgi:hypothetical protein